MPFSASVGLPSPWLSSLIPLFKAKLSNLYGRHCPCTSCLHWTWPWWPLPNCCLLSCTYLVWLHFRPSGWYSQVMTRQLPTVSHHKVTRFCCSLFQLGAPWSYHFSILPCSQRAPVALACFKKALFSSLSAYECQPATSTFLWLYSASGTRYPFLACSLPYLAFIFIPLPISPPSPAAVVSVLAPYQRATQYLNKLSILCIYISITAYTFTYFLSHSTSVLIFIYILFTLWLWQKAILRLLNSILIFEKKFL